MAKHTTPKMKCSEDERTDHACPGPERAHRGMWVTYKAGSDTWPYRMVWVSDSGRQAVVMRQDHLTGETKVVFGQHGPAMMIRQGADGRWWEEGPKYVGKMAVELGVGVLKLDRGF